LKFDYKRLIVCETSIRENFFPLTYTKLAADLLFGTETFLQKIRRKLECPVTDLFVPPYFAGLAKEIHPDIRVNEPVSEKCLVLNSLLSPSAQVWSFVLSDLGHPEQVVVQDSAGNFVFGRFDEFDPESVRKVTQLKKSGIKSLQISDNLDRECLVRYPWDLVNRNYDQLISDISEKNQIDKKQSYDHEVFGDRVNVSDSAQIDRYVTLDARKGPVKIEDEAVIQSFSHLTGPCYVGKKSIVKSGKIREGTSIGNNCKVAGEIEATIVSEYSNKSHDGFLGHSLIGSWVNLGALTTNSDLKNTYGKIKANLGRKSIDTGLIKAGITVGDMAKTAIGTLVMAGKKIGTGSHVFGTILEDVSSFTMYGKSYDAKSAEIPLDSVLTTQRRMMERRGLQISPEMEAMIRSVYKMTKSERAFQRVTKRRFKLS